MREKNRDKFTKVLQSIKKLGDQATFGNTVAANGEWATPNEVHGIWAGLAGHALIAVGADKVAQVTDAGTMVLQGGSIPPRPQKKAAAKASRKKTRDGRRKKAPRHPRSATAAVLEKAATVARPKKKRRAKAAGAGTAKPKRHPRNGRRKARRAAKTVIILSDLSVPPSGKPMRTRLGDALLHTIAGLGKNATSENIAEIHRDVKIERLTRVLASLRKQKKIRVWHKAFSLTAKGQARLAKVEQAANKTGSAPRAKSAPSVRDTTTRNKALEAIDTAIQRQASRVQAEKQRLDQLNALRDVAVSDPEALLNLIRLVKLD